MAEYNAVAGKERCLQEWIDDLVVLDDGSLWEIDPEQRDQIRDWVRFSRVCVTRNANRGEYRYTMLNGSYLQEASAKYVGQSAPNWATD